MRFIKNKKFILLSFSAIVFLSSMFLAGTNIIAEIDGHPWLTFQSLYNIF